MTAEKLNVVVKDGGNTGDAERLAEKLSVPVSENEADGLNVVFSRCGVSLSGYGLTYSGDFSSLLRRVGNGKLSHEMLVHAAKTKTENPSAFDAAAGMGEDSFLLAAYGYDVTLFEKDPVIACLLRDALDRAANNAETRDIVGRMHLVEGSSIELLPSYASNPDLVYLDPMFPERHKSGLINKKLQLIQKLEQPCVNEAELLDAAINVKPKKIIIKRPLKGAFLAGRKPNYSNEGKAIRYDCFVFPENF